MTASVYGVTDRPGRDQAARDKERLSFPRIVRSEWLKMRTLRSTWVALAAAMLVLVLAAGLIANHLHGRLAHPAFFQDPEERDVLTTPLRGFGLTQLIVGVLGVLTATGEYGTGMIRATFSAVPKRLPVLWAKLIVFAVVSFSAMVVAAFAAFFTAQSILGSYGVSIHAPHAVRVLLALAGYLTMIGLLGLGIGFIVRSTAGGIAALVGIVLVAPGILAAINTSWANTMSHYLPLNAGLHMMSDLPAFGGELSNGAATVVMIGWVLAGVALAAALISRRDA